ncbi:Serine/threonine protein kinase [Handroanthus impetiginosus]|uniref:Serine/threonine protein kinase n=1 Tax=Handroanthus impetiginosus TaxID=429701 RepID=A0A2G9HVH2_9LAMI|nr:Serine/threonine protein kinase [Handroanthus impetiginosus]
MFRSKSPYVSVSSISELTSSDPKEVAIINNVASSAVFPLDNEVIVPVMCSCSGQYYQANTSYVVSGDEDTYFTIANKKFQGLTTCDALKRENPYDEFHLFSGLKLQVPLRCACPTEDQIANGIKFVLTFLFTLNDTVPQISNKFNVSAKSVAEANGFYDENPVLYPFTTILIPLPKEPLSSQIKSFHPKATHKASHKGIFLGTGTGAALAVLFFVLFLGFFYYRRRTINDASWRLRQERKKQKLPENLLNKVIETLKIYTYEELKAATDDFNPQKRLSKSVYRGTLRGKLLAIKKMRTDVSKEIKILGNINHFNLISLYGVCEHGGIFYLVYEFLEEGSLKDWLHKENSPLAHSWNHRILIALDVANGLDYLHNFTSPAYVHKDIKSCNILLNGNLRAKIANFSLARENGNSESNHVVGEKGYMAPEYMQARKTTPKVDVYAFGVVLLELITGREAVFLRDDEEVLLSETVVSVTNGTDEGARITDLIDPRLQVKNPLGYIIDHNEVALCLLRLSLACLAREPEQRLSIAEVVPALMKIQLGVLNSESFSIE